MKVTLKVYRFNPQTDMQPHYDTFTVEAEPNDRILDCLNKVRWQQDSTLNISECHAPMESAAPTA